MDLGISLEKKLEILKTMYYDEKDEKIRKIILKEIKETEEVINVRDELARTNNQ